ncbi:MAG: hypothetical protein M3O70_21535 [Actinomycetota bacterium]|nr:hypothetical protein [Actinomycetota bacterium]
MPPIEVPAAVVRKMRRGETHELDWGVVLRPPTDPFSAGAAGSYRWDYYDPPVREDGTRGKRKGSSARDLETAWVKVTGKVAELEAKMRAQQTGYRLDMTFGQLALHYLDPKRHPEWNGDNHASTVRSITTNWLIADDITVVDPDCNQSAAEGSEQVPRVPLRHIPLRKLTASLMIEALGHVLQARAFGTYRTAHESATAIVTWAVTQKWAPAGWLDTRDIKRVADPRMSARRKGQRGNVSPVPKDDIAPLEELLRFRAHVEKVATERDVLLMDLLAFCGPRIGEVLALHESRWWRDHDANGWSTSRSGRRRPRRGSPHPSTASIGRCGCHPGSPTMSRRPGRAGWWFGAAQGGTWPVDRWRTRRFERWAVELGWPERDYCRHSQDAQDHGEESCPRGGQDRRRWRWSLHAWRHHAACYQLSELGLDPEDVADHLGHSDGYSCWQMYVGARPRRERRLAAAAARAGDPRPLSRS